jgi:hypothetical protein
MRRRLQAHLRVQQRRRVDEGVAVDAAQPREARVLEPGDRPQHGVCAPYFIFVWKPTML